MGGGSDIDIGDKGNSQSRAQSQPHSRSTFLSLPGEYMESTPAPPLPLVTLPCHASDLLAEYSPSSQMLRLTETFSSHSALRTNCLTLPNLLTGLLDDVAESFVGSGRVVLPMSHEDEDEESFHTKRNRNREPYREKMRNDLFGLQMVWWYADRLSLQALCCFWELRLRCADLHWEVSLVAMVARTSEVVI